MSLIKNSAASSTQPLSKTALAECSWTMPYIPALSLLATYLKYDFLFDHPPSNSTVARPPFSWSVLLFSHLFHFELLPSYLAQNCPPSHSLFCNHFCTFFLDTFTHSACSLHGSCALSRSTASTLALPLSVPKFSNTSARYTTSFIAALQLEPPSATNFCISVMTKKTIPCHSAQPHLWWVAFVGLHIYLIIL